MASRPPHVPAHLRELVVEQDYERYTAIDHAVWRFVLLQLRTRLGERAHPAYRDGLEATGISVERIPSIAQMNECLARFGWSAVCVDGFIPPRAFQELQACGILPIAAEMRTRDHLVYTPAPDIIHEAAGHAPILPEPVFSAYVRRIGDLGRKAFTLPEENAVFRAIHDLSEVKERPDAAPADVARASAALADAIARAAEPSEATRLSRLYWWTAEYGLVGRPDDYKLYGAGLLSSLGESASCHDPAVEKRWLDERCMDVAYDITRPQPHLYVTPSFEALHDVLDRAARSLGVNLGGATAIARAVASREVASVRFANGVWVTGVVAAADVGDRGGWIRLEGPVGLTWDGDESARGEWLVVFGAADDGSRLDALDDAGLSRLRRARRLGFASGSTIEGEVERVVRREGRVTFIDWRDARVCRPGQPPWSGREFRLVVAGDLVTAQAGAVDPRFHAETPFSAVRVPAPPPGDPAFAAMLALYELAERAHRAGAGAVAATFPSIHEALERDYPREWLLRWNLLESLLKFEGDGDLARALEAELERLEGAYDGRQPIASGLRYLATTRRAA